jgi:KipI family sensor histidine kinase inhibitor
LARVLDRLDEIGPLDAAGAATATAPIEIPVRYDGDDLESVAERAGLTIAAVIAAHVSATYSVAFCGFAPGFAYLAGLDPALHLPRRVAPRTRVPAGSVAVAAEYSAVYPTASPGGWHLLGRTDLAMFDPARTPAVLLEPGCTVRFVAV